MQSCIKSAAVSCDVYKSKAFLFKTYDVSKYHTRFIEGPGKREHLGMSVYDQDDKKLYVVLKGCKNIEEVLECVDTKMKKPFLGRTFKTNRAIWNKYEEVKENIDIVVRECQEEFGGLEGGVVFTGHSLGGAIAQICALLYDGGGDRSCINFGSPYVGDADFKRDCGDVIQENIRVAVKQDIVPKIKFNDDLVHVGKEILVGSMSNKLNLVEHHKSVNYLRCLVRDFGF
jgi:hypothetical protein